MSAQGASVDFLSSVQVSGGVAPAAVTCAPGSGATFPVGTTSVTCTATDGAAQRQSCQFDVRVTLVCTLTVSPLSVVFGFGGGTGFIRLTGAGACDWTATSSEPWITVVPPTGQGEGTLSYTVAPFSGAGDRTGLITVAGQTVTIRQVAPPPCAFTLSSPTQPFSAAGGTGTITVTAAPHCSWTAASADPWLTVTPGSAGLGNGTVAFAVAGYVSTLPRTGRVLVANQTAMILQNPSLKLGLTRYLAFGDSLTYGTDSPPVQTFDVVPGSYPFELERLLAERYPLQAQSISVLNAGLRGEHAVDAANRGRLTGELTRAIPRPDVVFLMEGANDLVFVTLGFTTFQRIENALDAMLDEVRRQGMTACLISVLPQRPGGRQADTAPLVPLLNDRLRDLARRRSVLYLDLYSVFAARMSLIGADDLHPTKEGYLVFAQTLANVLRMYEVPFGSSTLTTSEPDASRRGTHSAPRRGVGAARN